MQKFILSCIMYIMHRKSQLNRWCLKRDDVMKVPTQYFQIVSREKDLPNHLKFSSSILYVTRAIWNVTTDFKPPKKQQFHEITRQVSVTR